MKKLFVLLAIVGACAAPARAQIPDDPYELHYQFQFRYQNGALSEESLYHVATGVTAPQSGSWRITLFGPRGQELGSWPMDPSANGNRPVVFIPYADNGTTVRVFDANGATKLTIDVSWNRVCNEDGQCAADRGENADTCPADCLSGQAALSDDGTASIWSVAGDAGSRIGLALLGFLILLVAFRTLDSHRAS